MSETLIDSWLVQRLKKPLGGGRFDKAIESFSFGGGYRNGGLSEDAMGMLRGIFSFDYMGSAEFEWGDVPKALNRLAKARDLVATSVQIPLATVPASWRDKNATQPTGEASVYLLCRKPEAAEVERRIREWAAGKEGIKERVGLSSALRPYSEWDGEVCGWLELDNGFMFFTSEQMWSATAALFGVKTSTAVAS